MAVARLPQHKGCAVVACQTSCNSTNTSTATSQRPMTNSPNPPNSELSECICHYVHWHLELCGLVEEVRQTNSSRSTTRFLWNALLLVQSRMEGVLASCSIVTNIVAAEGWDLSTDTGRTLAMPQKFWSRRSNTWLCVSAAVHSTVSPRQCHKRKTGLGSGREE